MNKSTVLFSLLLMMLAPWVQAKESKVEQSLNTLGIAEVDLQPSPVSGIQIAFTDKGIFYVTDDGNYVIQGPMIDVSTGVPHNVTSTFLKQRLDKMESTMIIYPAKQEKFVVTVFTDISCGYCKKLHKQIKEYNDLGITIRYLAFPREGLDSAAGEKMRSIWCSANRNKALDEAIKGEDIVPITCSINLKQQYETGLQFGVQGTPAMVLSDGTLLPGYQQPPALLSLLQEHQESIQVPTAAKQK